MSDLVRVVPAEGRLVRDLQGVRIPDEGAVVDRSVSPIYWHRLERSGDVVIGPVPAAPAPQAEPAPAPSLEE